AAQVEGRCAVDIDILVLDALPGSDTRILSSPEILRQTACDFAKVVLTSRTNIRRGDADDRCGGWRACDPCSGHDDRCVGPDAVGIPRVSPADDDRTIVEPG